MAALDTKKRMMEKIEFGTACLSLLMRLGSNILEVTNISKVVATVVTDILNVCPFPQNN